MFVIEEEIILSLVDKKYKYITRDFNGNLFLWGTKPKKNKDNREWDSDGLYCNFTMFNGFFVDIQYSDPQPFKFSTMFENRN